MIYQADDWKLHVCLLTSTRLFEIAYGGEGRFTTSLGKWLFKRGHDVTLIGSGFANAKSKRLSRLDLEIDDKVSSKETMRKIRILYPPYSIFLLSRLIMCVLWVTKILLLNIKSPITLIHSQDSGYAGLAAVISGKIIGIPVIITSHGIRHKSLESIIYGKLKRILLRIEYNLDIFTMKNAEGVIAVNSKIKEYFENKTSKKIDFIPIPIKLKEFEFFEENKDRIRGEMRLDEDIKVLGFVGRFSPEKNLFTLLTSFANVTQLTPSIRLIMVGTGQIESQLKEYSINNGIRDKIIFCGVRYDINMLLASFDIFVLPSYTEGLSTALLEAMASGRAIICSDIPANREVVTHNQEALLINPYNVEELENAIKLLLENKSIRLRLGENAKIKAMQYDEDKVLAKIERLYGLLSMGLAK